MCVDVHYYYYHSFIHSYMLSKMSAVCLCLCMCVWVFCCCLFILSACLISLPFFVFVDVFNVTMPRKMKTILRTVSNNHICRISFFSLDSFDECVYFIWVVYGCCCFKSFTISIHSMVWMVQPICPHVHAFVLQNDIMIISIEFHYYEMNRNENIV